VSGIAPSPASCAAAARGAVALAVPLLLGVWTGAVVPSVVAGIGALWGVGQDGFDPYHHRVRRLGGMGLCAAAGLLAGELALRSGHPAAVTVCLVAAALVAGAVGLRGRIGAVCGMHLLLGVTVGGGIPMPGPWWHAPLALLAGVLLVVVLSAAPWLWRRHDVERAAVLAVYRAAAAALSAAGTPAAEDARRRLTAALDHAHHVMDRHLTHDGREQPQRAALREAFDTAVRLGEVTSALLWEGRPLPARAIEVPALLAARLLPAAGRRAGRADAGRPRRPTRGRCRAPNRTPRACGRSPPWRPGPTGHRRPRCPPGCRRLPGTAAPPGCATPCCSRCASCSPRCAPRCCTSRAATGCR
jgi:hypothetical protein